MNKLNVKADELKKKYHKIFLEILKIFNSKMEKMKAKELKEFLKSEALKEIFIRQKKLLEEKKKVNCSCCGSCCKLAVSEFSPEILKEKAKNGDKTSIEFISTFIPYEDEEDARKNYPEYFELLAEKNIEGVYYYHCPKVTKDNKCSDYENRPEICKNFPDNPIEFLPKKCAYKLWQEKSEEEALVLHAMLEIVMFYKKKLGI